MKSVFVIDCQPFAVIVEIHTTVTETDVPHAQVLTQLRKQGTLAFKYNYMSRMVNNNQIHLWRLPAFTNSSTCVQLRIVTATRPQTLIFVHQLLLTTKNLQAQNGLLFSNEVLFITPDDSLSLINLYANSQEAFFNYFTTSMFKMGRTKVLTGNEGQVHTNCRIVNVEHERKIRVVTLDKMPMQSNVLVAVDLRVQMIRVVSLNRFQIQTLDSYSILRLPQ